LKISPLASIKRKTLAHSGTRALFSRGTTPLALLNAKPLILPAASLHIIQVGDWLPR